MCEMRENLHDQFQWELEEFKTFVRESRRPGGVYVDSRERIMFDACVRLQWHLGEYQGSMMGECSALVVRGSPLLTIHDKPVQNCTLHEDLPEYPNPMQPSSIQTLMICKYGGQENIHKSQYAIAHYISTLKARDSGTDQYPSAHRGNAPPTWCLSYYILGQLDAC